MRFLLAIILFLFIGCTNTLQRQAKCPKKPPKQKTYRVKKLKSVARPPSMGSSGSRSASMEEEVEITASQEEPTPNIATEQEQAKRPESSGSIPDLKANTIPDFDAEVIEFRGKEVDIKKGFSFDEEIPFTGNSDLLLNPLEAANQIADLKKVLKNNPDIKVTVVGNVATDQPSSSMLYGNSIEVKLQAGTLNGKQVPIGEIMMARANRIKSLLISEGVNPNQIVTQTGSNRKWKHERVVTFILKKDGEEVNKPSSFNPQENNSSSNQTNSTLTPQKDSSLSNLKEVAEEIAAGNGDEAGYTFEEFILFKNNSDTFKNPDSAESKTTDLINIMIENPNSKLVIYGNTASDNPKLYNIYGFSNESLSEEAQLNGQYVARRELMMARAKSIQNLLTSNGVNPGQIKIKAGSHRRWAKDRSVTFILHDSEFKLKGKGKEYRGLEVPSNYEYYEKVDFAKQSNQFKDSKKTKQLLSELIELLKQHKELEVKISSNTYSLIQIEDVLYGGSEEVLNQQTTLNGNPSTLGETMMAQGNQIKKLLEAQGINRNRITVLKGEHLYNEYGKYTKLIIQ